MKIFLMISVAVLLMSAPVLADDTQMTCEEITAELTQLNEIQTAAGNAETNNKITQAGTTAAVHGAMWAGAGSSVPFLGGIANAVGAVTSVSADSAKKNAEEAEDRMIKLQTISEMKGCS
jgi:hypothetical protein